MESKTVTIFQCSWPEFLTEARARKIQPWYGLEYLRGFYIPVGSDGGLVYIVKDCPGELALVAHEVGHVLGRKHTRWPGIMNFSGLFRWFANEPRDLKRLLTGLRGK